ncbi:MAG: thioredoxin family protein [Candidatus Kapabacteria bacterium]|nr:thioredoxin family protein [Candidatus Kapabacteria bacterium]
MTANDIFEVSISYNEYRSITVANIEAYKNGDRSMRNVEKMDTVILNHSRMNRIEKHYQPNSALREAIAAIDTPQTWIVISEDWCGDSAQIVPYLNAIASLNDNILFGIVIRDMYPDVMDLYLTDGTRGIPKLIAFGKDGAELFTYGPRPAPGAALVAERKAQGISKDQFLEELQRWYNTDKGMSLEQEILQRIQQVTIPV